MGSLVVRMTKEDLMTATATAPVDLITETPGVVVSATEFRAALRDADLARSRDSWRQRGIYSIRLERLGDLLVFTSTDSYMLLERSLQLVGDQPAGDWVVLIDGDDVPVLDAHLRQAGKGHVALTVEGQALHVLADGRELACTPNDPDVEFPDTDKHWPADKAAEGSKVALNPKFLARLDRLSESKSAHNPARFSLFGDLNPVLVEIGQSTRVLLMPVRMS